MGIFRSFLFGLLLYLALGLSGMPNCSAQQGNLWRPDELPKVYVLTPQAVTFKGVRINIDQFKDAKNNNRFSLTLPDGSTIVVTKLFDKVIDNNQYLWHGRIDGKITGVATFSLVGNRLSGDIVTTKNDRPVIYRIKYADDGIHLLEELDPKKFPPESPGKAKSSGLRAIYASADPDTIDIVVLYTKAARDAAVMNQDSVLAVINQAMFDTEISYTNSRVFQKLHLAYAGEVNYTEKNSIDQDRDALSTADPADGQIANIRAIQDVRRKYSGDIVVLITKVAQPTDSCGSSMQMHTVTTAHCKYAFAVVPLNCATGVYSFAHELGHIMGADHEAGGSSSPPFPFSHGYIQPHPSWRGTTPWRTIMAQDNGTCGENGCQRILYWSNPLVSYSGDPTGDLSAYNARALNDSAFTVARFFPSPDCH